MNKLFLILIAFSFLFIWQVQSVDAATHYVDWETGTDSPYSGSMSNPWKTPWYADDMINEGDTVVVLPRDGNQSYATSTFGNCQSVLEISTPNTTWKATTSLISEIIVEYLASTTTYIASGTEMIATTTWYIATSSQVLTTPILGRTILSQTGDRSSNAYCFCGGVASSTCDHSYLVDSGQGTDSGCAIPRRRCN